MSMQRLLWDWWGQIWPNLAASALVFGPLFAWHHRRIKAHITAAAQAERPPVSSKADIRVAGGNLDEELRKFRARPGGLR